MCDGEENMLGNWVGYGKDYINSCLSFLPVYFITVPVFNLLTECQQIL